MSNLPDTNQASEDELKQYFATLFYDDNYEYMLSKPELFDVGAIDAAVDLIRTEKLKLLAEVRERVIGEDLPPDVATDSGIGYSRQQFAINMGKAGQRTELTKLEAEL